MVTSPVDAPTLDSCQSEGQVTSDALEIRYKRLRVHCRVQQGIGPLSDGMQLESVWAKTPGEMMSLDNDRPFGQKRKKARRKKHLTLRPTREDTGNPTIFLCSTAC